MAERTTFYIREHHLKFRITADCFPDRTPDELADEWIAGIVQSPRLEARYQTLQNPVARQAMQDGFAQHIRDFRAGKTPVVVERENANLDPICAKCVNVWCGDSTINRKSR